MMVDVTQAFAKPAVTCIVGGTKSRVSPSSMSLFCFLVFVGVADGLNVTAVLGNTHEYETPSSVCTTECGVTNVGSCLSSETSLRLEFSRERDFQVVEVSPLS